MKKQTSTTRIILKFHLSQTRSEFALVYKTSVVPNATKWVFKKIQNNKLVNSNMALVHDYQPIGFNMSHMAHSGSHYCFDSGGKNIEITITKNWSSQTMHDLALFLNQFFNNQATTNLELFSLRFIFQ